MGYQMSNGRYANTTSVVLLASATKTTSGNGDALEVGDARCARLTVAATAVSGTDPGLTVSLQGSPDGTTWHTIGSFTELDDVGSERKVFLCDRFIRAAWAISGEDAGSCSAVTQTGDGPVVTVSGTPAADAEFVVEVTTGGSRTALRFRWSVDGGETWEAEDVEGSATVVLGTTGVTASFADVTAGSVGALTKNIPGPPIITITGEPDDAYDLMIEIENGGTIGEVTFRWSLNGGATWVASGVPVAATVTLGTTGMTANCPEALYDMGATYNWATTAPVDYVDGTTYEWTADDPDPDTSATFSVTGELV